MLKLIGEGKDSILVDENNKPIYTNDMVAFLRDRYNLCVSEMRNIENRAKHYGVIDPDKMQEEDKILYKADQHEADIICKYIADHNIDYGEIDPETGLIVEGTIRK